MFQFNQQSVSRKTTGKKVPASLRPTVCYVSPSVLDQVARKGLNQAQITLRGADAEKLAEYRGPIVVQIGEEKLSLIKTDTHAVWASRQGGNLEAFGRLFNLLVEEKDGQHNPRPAVTCIITRA